MLKWAVNGSKQSYLSTVGKYEPAYSQSNACLGLEKDSIVKCRRVRCKSPNVNYLRRKKRAEDKENQLTSTPLPVAMRSFSPRGFTDFSNISTFEDVSEIPTLKEERLEQSTQLLRPMPANYASTLPTFDAEYSPCGAVAGPVLAFRGIADSYFEKPRYLTQEFQERSKRRSPRRPLLKADESSPLRSSKMGDTTLERMIDAILESAHKERKLLKSSKPAASPLVMSRTYTPADDPASDLHEFWDVPSCQYQQQEHRKANSARAFNEREVRSPLSSTHYKKMLKQTSDRFRWRRQRVVRRKRKRTASVGAQSAELQLTQCKDHGDGQTVNVSPDSGRNSPSDYEDLQLDRSSSVTLNAGSNSRLDVTKRRLSFSFNDLFEH